MSRRRAERQAIRLVARRRRRGTAAAGEVLVEPGGLGRLERPVQALGGAGLRPVVRRRPVVRPTADAAQPAHDRGSIGSTAVAGRGIGGGVGGRFGLGIGGSFDGQGLAQALAGPGQEGPGGDVADAQRGGELDAGQVVELGQEEGGALALRDPREGPLHVARQVGVHHQVLGRRAPPRATRRSTGRTG